MLILAFGYSYGIYYTYFMNEFNLSNTSFASLWSAEVIVATIFSPLAGYMLQRFSVQKITLLAAFLSAIGLMASGLVTNFLQLYITYGVFMGIAVSITGNIPIININSYFKKNRGIPLGIVLSGVGIGIIIFPLISESLISLYNWRSTLIILGLSCGLLLFFSSMIIKSLSKSIVNVINTSAVQITQKIYKSPKFLSLYIVAILAFIHSTILLLYISPYSLGLGFSHLGAAFAISMVGVGSILARLVVGALSNKVNKNKILLVTFLLQSITALLFVSYVSDYLLYIYALLFGMFYGSTLITLYSGLNDIIPTRQFPYYLGLFHTAFGIGSLIGPLSSGFLLDVYGDFQIVFLQLLIVSLFGSILLYKYKF